LLAAIQRVSQLAENLVQFILIDQVLVDLLLQLSDLNLLAVDLDLLEEDYQEKSEHGDDNHNRPKPQARP
jgi:hypothetical protein